jgi:phosphatidylinositol alpha-1,6-mannosyltransferase
MRILLVTPDFPPQRGGIQNLLERVAAGLSHRHAVRVVAVARSDAVESGSGRNYMLTCSPAVGSWLLSIGLLTFVALVEIVRHRPDLIICGHVVLGHVCRVARRLLSIPYIAIAHGSEIRAPKMGRIAGVALRGAAYIVTGSEFTRRAVLTHGVSAERVMLIRPGAACRVDEAESAQPNTRGRQVVLCVSRLVERYKGHDMVIRALPLILAKVPDVEYVVVGDGWLRPHLTRLAASVGVQNSVTFTGEVSAEEVDGWYRRCDVFILASRDSRVDGGAEGYGIAFIEANLRGKPVIGGRSGGVPDAVMDGVTGLLVNPTDIGEIAEAVVRLLTDRELAKRLGAEGRKRALGDLSWQNYVSRFNDVLVAVGQARARGLSE